ncbi:hypothetical protein [Streptococcus pluranimalium]|uniref:hypothetical protein n=1 Tax=Streptococcus pluranimalium TaxID=82348 RepID=UPI0039FCBFFF
MQTNETNVVSLVLRCEVSYIMKLLVVGSGGRGHAIAKKLLESSRELVVQPICQVR